MRLEVLLPTRVLIDEPVTKVIAEAENGFFCLLAHHRDITAALVPGLLSFTPTETAGPANTATGLLGIDEGVLVKCGEKVLVSTLNAVRGDDLETLRATVRQRFVDLDERERVARSALARLEAGVLRRMLQLGERAR